MRRLKFYKLLIFWSALKLFMNSKKAAVFNAKRLRSAFFQDNAME